MPGVLSHESQQETTSHPHHHYLRHHLVARDISAGSSGHPLDRSPHRSNQPPSHQTNTHGQCHCISARSAGRGCHTASHSGTSGFHPDQPGAFTKRTLACTVLRTPYDRRPRLSDSHPTYRERTGGTSSCPCNIALSDFDPVRISLAGPLAALDAAAQCATLLKMAIDSVVLLINTHSRSTESHSQRSALFSSLPLHHASPLHQAVVSLRITWTRHPIDPGSFPIDLDFFCRDLTRVENFLLVACHHRTAQPSAPPPPSPPFL